MAARKDSDAKRELIDTGSDKRFQRRNDDGTFGASDDVSRSLSQDQKRTTARQKPRGQGDRGD